MCCPKSHIIRILFVFIFIGGSISQAQELLLKTDETTSSYRLDYGKLNTLIANDSLYKATVLLEEALDISKEKKLKLLEAEIYNSLGRVFNKITNYNDSEAYYLKALNLNRSLNNLKGKNISLTGLGETYILKNTYAKFDSLYPIAQNLAKELNSELYFKNLENKVKRNYYSFNNKEMFTVTNNALTLIKATDFNTLNFSSEQVNAEEMKEHLFQSFSYYNAISAVKIDGNKKEDYELLFNLNEERLKHSLGKDIDSYRKLATLNYYKYRYYNYVEKNLDSANKYLLKSDEHKYNALIDIQKQYNKNGQLISKIINTQQQLNLANAMQKEEKRASQFYLTTTILSVSFLLVSLTLLYFYFKAKKHNDIINKELKSSNKKLMVIDKERLEFFSILSHELRTPIYGITGLATLIDQEKDSSKSQYYLDSLISSSNYLSILIDNILQVNRLRFEDKKLRLKPDRIEKIVNHVMSSVSVAAKNKGLELKTNIQASDKDEFILIDKVAFSQILINLAYNAIRYTKEGSVSINVKEKSRTKESVTLHFEIKDTGIGIAEKHRSIVFSAFENRAFLEKNSSGSGLGLHIVKTLLNSHNTDIDFVSQPNVGTTFFFDITFKLAEIIPEKKSTLITTQRDLRALVVDDNKINLLITKKNIEKIGGFTCETVTNGREAISMIKEMDFDIVLMDINMPDMDGYEATKHIRMFNAHIPVLALTALNSNEISYKAEQAGINQIITKPYILEDFKTVIASYVNTTYNEILKNESVEV